MKQIYLIGLSVAVVLFILVREYFARAHSYRQSSELLVLETEMKVLESSFLDMIEYDRTVLNCRKSESAFSMNVFESISSLTYPSYATSWLMWILQVSLSFSAMLLELLYSHTAITCNGNEKGFKMYVQRRYPLSIVLLLSGVFLFGCFAWLNLLSLSDFIYNILTFMFVWFCCGPFALFCFNARRLWCNYMPDLQDSEEWKKKLLDVHWWVWVGSRCLGIDDLASGLHWLLSHMLTVWLIWPYRYYYYYGMEGVCDTHKPPTAPSHIAQYVPQLLEFHKQCMSAVFNGNETNDYIENGNMNPSTATATIAHITASSTIHTFVLNMMMQLCFLLVWYHGIRLLTYGSPYFMRFSSWGKKRYFILGAALIVVAVNSVLALFRIIWFLWFSGCYSWYGVMITWIFLVPHILLPFISITLIVTLVEKLELEEKMREPITSQLVSMMRLSEEVHMESAKEEEYLSRDETVWLDRDEVQPGSPMGVNRRGSAGWDARSKEHNSKTMDTIDTQPPLMSIEEKADFIFDLMIDKATRSHVFQLNEKKDNEDSEAANPEDKKKENVASQFQELMAGTFNEIPDEE